jgi:hypothetical protein
MAISRVVRFISVFPSLSSMDGGRRYVAVGIDPHDQLGAVDQRVIGLIFHAVGQFLSRRDDLLVVVLADERGLESIFARSAEKKYQREPPGRPRNGRPGPPA